VKKFYMRLL